MAAVSAALAVAIGVLSLPGPQASAGELRDKQKQAHRQVEKADEALEESSAALRRATRALSRTREELVEARAELGDVRARLQIAQQQDEEMKAALAAAEARLAQAQADVAAGKTALTTQQELVVDTITDIYEQGDPSLLAFTSILNAQTPSDITRQREANSSLILRQDNEYDDLRAAEVLLKVHENEVQEATAEVAEQRQEAADHLVEMQDLTQEALEAKENVKAKVGDRKAAEAMAAKAKKLDRKALAKAKRQEARIQKLIQEAIRKARERARRKAAAAAAKANKGGAPIDTNGLLMRPVSGPVTSAFGYRVHPIYHYWGLHDGDDFGAPCGAPLAAVRNGKVLTEYYSSVWGNRLYLNVGLVNGKFITVIYNHLSRYAVGTGAVVKRGQTIGYVGTTGWSTGCHLHFTVMENGKPVDPMKYF
ncbi:MAG TPA: peptidoglycan DD-metalloendopeptidase family protein [Nocardioides sp.]|nr:peptidoglycan DD-metalloendopeptidase family protein [Nocardioides sp.]